ncbi:MAG: NACHT domain-containing protein, partial [Proteobacteria bacterium]|nr:NACHT domain-containing protein [Pseudomonadota bacterium]
MYAEELKSCYKAKTYTSDDDDDDIQWPPPVDDKHKIFRLEIVEAKRKIRRTEVDSAWARSKTIDDKVDEVVRQRGPIELRDIFKKLESQSKVLLEGAPGCGKSTLSFHVCHQWADGKLFQEYKLVVLIRLRDSIAQDAPSIDTLLQDAVGDIAEEIKASKGKDVLLVLDGWDELPKGKPGHTVILDLIKSKTLSQSSIIITSRPTSSANLHKYVSLRAEILGFSKSELQSYFEFCLKDESIGKDVGDLLKRIENNAIIEGICYLPLNASILVHLFICGRGELPNTQYGIFSDLICNCIYRYLKKIGVDAAEIDSLDELPQSIDSQFQE